MPQIDRLIFTGLLAALIAVLVATAWMLAGARAPEIPAYSGARLVRLTTGGMV